MREDVELTDFSAGELSPKLKGRVDLKRYFSGCATLLNMVPMPQGGATKRPRTVYVANNKDQAGLNRPVRFVFSTLQAYVLEFSNGNVRVYMDDGVVLTGGGSPVDVAVPYATADLQALKFTQSADTLYIFHQNYPTATLTRSSHTSWSYAPLVLRDGPYLDINTTTTSVAPSGTNGTITLTFSSTVGINGGAGLSSADVGRHVRVKVYSLWAWCIIATVSSSTVCSANVQGEVGFGATNSLDGNAWFPESDYIGGAIVANSGSFYVCTVGGRSGTGVGPYGPGTQILDGTVTWSLLGGFNAVAWQANTLYDSGVVIFSGGGSYYQCGNPGLSAMTGTGPSGAGQVTDGTVIWTELPIFTLPTATNDWQLGSYCASVGYPGAGKFWQERLQLAAPKNRPNHIDASVSGDFTNFAPSTADGTVTDANALSWTLDDDEVNAIHALSPAGSAQSMQLALFTDSGEHVLQASSASQALTPTSVQAYRETSYGSAPNVEPLRIGKSVLFTDLAGRKMREFSFYWQSSGYLGPDLLQFSEHITRAPDGADASLSGIKWWAYQQAPYQVIWAGLNNGKLISFTYDRDQQVFAPAQHQLGGNFHGGPAVVEFGTVIPSPDGTYDELWLTVLRTINGAEVRFMEVMDRFFDAGDPDTAFFADAALETDLSYPGATLTISGLTDNDPTDQLPETRPPSFTGSGYFTANAPSFSPATVGAIIRVNGGKVLVTSYGNSEVVGGLVLRPLQSLIPAPAGKWSCTTTSANVSGLGYLEGENVVLVGDGAYLGESVVSSGAVALKNPSSLIYAGLPYTPVIVSMPFEPQRAAAASSQGKMKRIDTLWVRFYQTLGCSFGRRMTDSLTNVQYDRVEAMLSRSAQDAMNNAPALYSGIRKFSSPGGHDDEGQIIISQVEPLPLTVLAIFARGDVSEVAG
jgi:hypothetical protein